MITAVTQRWRQGRTRYLPRREVIRPAEFEVAPLMDDGEAKLFIVRHHYSRSYPAARRRFGLYRRSQLVGCAVFSYPTHTKALTNVFDYQALSACYLGRSAPRALRLLPDGRVIHERAIQKIRGGERGWRYAARPLEEFGASPAPSGDKTAWLNYWLERLTRKLPHGGNHKYAWALE